MYKRKKLYNKFGTVIYKMLTNKFDLSIGFNLVSGFNERTAQFCT